MIKILHILSSTKRDLEIINIYDSLNNLENTFLFEESIAKKKIAMKNFHY
jgi:hypothetical protein